MFLSLLNLFSILQILMSLSMLSITCTMVVAYSGKAFAIACAPSKFVRVDNPTNISRPEIIEVRRF